MAAKQCKTAATADSTYCTDGIFSLPGLLLNTLNVLFRSWFRCGSSLPSLVLCTESSICTVQCTGAGSSAVPPSPPWSSTESSKYSVQVLVPVRLLPPLPVLYTESSICSVQVLVPVRFLPSLSGPLQNLAGGWADPQGHQVQVDNIRLHHAR